MVTVSVEPKADGWVCQVQVESAGKRSQHVVTVARGDCERWGRGADVEDLVRRSFSFLLERESPSSILQRFDLSVIQSYFPEYDREMKR